MPDIPRENIIPLVNLVRPLKVDFILRFLLHWKKLQFKVIILILL